MVFEEVYTETSQQYSSPSQKCYGHSSRVNMVADSRLVLLYHGQRKKLTDVYGEGVLSVRQFQNWFAKFRSGNFDVEDAPRSGRPVEVDKGINNSLANRRITTREIGLRLNLSNSIVYDHLKGLGLSSKLDVWVPHVLTERNLCRHIDVCNSLLKCHENDPFMKHIITGDEKDEPAQTISKADIHQKKVMLSVWWDFKGICF
ncbi:histone-lysine N-methyltransferase SETMAR [Trichonephila clavipes]|uniref:Histone-lysine N-methyltransferase SETMAR n=1 Tax=Trichonephila clavipes TaxID=2585209 RepID=A0A8X6RV91_TRICX|nr:histone-lysine N-methyltransferase SETMAR [Trichonephila clavipes]